MNNIDYWLSRSIDRNNLSIQEENALLREIYDLLADAYQSTIDELYIFYTEYADEEGITISQAQEILSPIELRDCADRIKRLSELLYDIDINTPFGQQRYTQLQREITLLRNRGRVTRQQMLNDAINEQWIKTALQIDERLGEHLAMNYERSFKDGLEEAGVKRIINISRRQIESAILIPKFTYHFSSAVWRNKDRLVTFINTELRRGIVNGTDVRKTAKILKDNLVVTKYEAKRLVVTETSIVQIDGRMEGYRSSGVVQKLQVLVHMDNKTCGRCKDHENSIVDLPDAIIGDNIPPFHPICRCDVSPYFE